MSRNRELARQEGDLASFLKLGSSNLFAWDHNLDRIQKVVCWELGDIEDSYMLDDGTKVRYEKSGKKPCPPP